MPNANGQAQAPAVDPTGVALAHVMGQHTPLLAAILAELRGGVIEVGVGDAKFRQMVLDQFPVPGCKRVLAYRTGNGTDAAQVQTGTYAAPVSGLVLGANEARLGGTIVNIGTAPVNLYLTDRPVPVVGVPALQLAVGGTWDFRLGALLWCGHVSAAATTGTSTLTVAEV